MTLEYLQNAMYEAMKCRDVARKEVLSSIIANVNKAAIDKKCKDNIPEQMINDVILKEKKTIQEMIDTCPADRTTTLAEYKERLNIIEQYAPSIISDPVEVREIILQCCESIEFTMKNKGLIMKTISAQYKGKIDMKVVQEVVSESLT
jgi:uncharacterized protein YqeY